jgi:hypothetical protein
LHLSRERNTAEHGGPLDRMVNFGIFPGAEHGGPLDRKYKKIPKNHFSGKKTANE